MRVCRAYVGTGLIILSSMSDGVTTCERPFWQYAYYTLGAPVLLAVIGLTSKHPCGRLLLWYVGGAGEEALHLDMDDWLR